MPEHLENAPNFPRKSTSVGGISSRFFTSKINLANLFANLDSTLILRLNPCLAISKFYIQNKHENSTKRWRNSLPILQIFRRVQRIPAKPETQCCLVFDSAINVACFSSKLYQFFVLKTDSFIPPVAKCKMWCKMRKCALARKLRILKLAPRES